jgi:drug/metabolite transporter (DMT)-like permease
MTAFLHAASSRLAIPYDKFLGILVLLLATALLGTSNSIQKTLLEHADPWAILALRASLAVFILLPFAKSEWRGNKHQHAVPPYVAWLIVVSFALGMILQNLAGAHTSATNVGFLINASVIFMPIVLWLMQSDRITISTLLPAGFCFVGASLLSGGQLTSMGYGDLLCLLSACAYTVWIAAISKLGAKCESLITYTCLQWVPIIFVGLAMTDMTMNEIMQNLQTYWLDYILLGVIASGLAYVFAIRAQQHVSATCAAIIYPMEGVFGAIAANLLLGEIMSPLGLMGATIIIASIWMTSKEKAPQNKV